MTGSICLCLCHEGLGDIEHTDRKCPCHPPLAEAIKVFPNRCPGSYRRPPSWTLCAVLARFGDGGHARTAVVSSTYERTELSDSTLSEEIELSSDIIEEAITALAATKCADDMQEFFRVGMVRDLLSKATLPRPIDTIEDLQVLPDLSIVGVRIPVDGAPQGALFAIQKEINWYSVGDGRMLPLDKLGEAISEGGSMLLWAPGDSHTASTAGGET